MSKRSKMLAQAALGAALGVWSVSQTNAALQYQLYYGGSQATSWATSGATDSRIFDVYAIITGAGIVEGGLTDGGIGINLSTGAGTNVASATATVGTSFQAPGYSVGSPTAAVNGVSGIGGASVLSDTGWINYRAATSSFFVPGTLDGGSGEVRLLIGTVTVSVSNIASGNPINMDLVVRNAGTFNTQIWYESTQAGYAGSTASAGARADFSTGPAVLGVTGFAITLGGGGPNEWGTALSGNFGDSTKWTGAAVPTGVALFGTQPVGAVAVNMEAAHTVTGVTFNNSNSYTVSGINALTIDNGVTATAITLTAGSHTISAPLVLKSNTTITAAASTQTFTGGSVTVDSGKTLTVAASTKVVADHLTGGGLAVNGTLTLTEDTLSARQTPAIVTVLETLTLGTNGKLDIGNHDAVVRGGNAVVIAQSLADGFGVAQDWSGTKGITTAVGALNGVGIGMALQDNLGISSWQGVSIASGDVLLKYAYYGDADLNGVVDDNDFSYFQVGYGGAGTYDIGDFDLSGTVDDNDFSWFQVGYGSGPLLSPSFEASVAVVPEPATLGLLGLSFGLLLRRRK